MREKNLPRAGGEFKSPILRWVEVNKEPLRQWDQVVLEKPRWRERDLEAHGVLEARIDVLPVHRVDGTGHDDPRVVRYRVHCDALLLDREFLDPVEERDHGPRFASQFVAQMRDVAFEIHTHRKELFEDLTRNRGILVVAELDGEAIGWIEDGNADESLREGLLGEWQRSLERQEE